MKRGKVLNTRRDLVLPISVRETEGKDRTLTFVASTEDVASDGDIVLVDGWDLDTRFARNPVVLWGHNAWELPVGRGVDWRKITKGDKALEVDVEFAGHEQFHDFAETVYWMLKDRFLRACSVGFWIRAYEKPDDETKEELGLGPWGIVVTKAELIELSIVTIGADGNALLKDGEVPREVQQELCAMRSALSNREALEEFDQLVRELPGPITIGDSADTTGSTNHTTVTHEVRPVLTRADLVGLEERIDMLCGEVAELRDDLRAGELADRPECSPARSEPNPDTDEEDEEELELARALLGFDRIGRRNGR